MKSDEKDPLHYNIDSDNEPPTDSVGDKITVIKKGQAIKEILEVTKTYTFISILCVNILMCRLVKV